jgi:hypothetical protein
MEKCGSNWTRFATRSGVAGSWRENMHARRNELRKKVYFAFNQGCDDARRDVRRLRHEAAGVCRAHPLERLIIDIRNHSGGDNTLFRPFIRELARSPLNQRGRLSRLSGGRFLGCREPHQRIRTRNPDSV